MQVLHHNWNQLVLRVETAFKARDSNNRELLIIIVPNSKS